MFLQNTFGMSDKELYSIIMLSGWLELRMSALFVCSHSNPQGCNNSEEQLNSAAAHSLSPFSWCHNSAIHFLSFFLKLTLDDKSLLKSQLACEWMRLRQMEWQQKHFKFPCLNQVCGCSHDEDSDWKCQHCPSKSVICALHSLFYKMLVCFY